MSTGTVPVPLGNVIIYTNLFNIYFLLKYFNKDPDMGKLLARLVPLKGKFKIAFLMESGVTRCVYL